MDLPSIIQGGMGVAVSNWTLARAVSRCGQHGVVSGTGLNVVLTRRLQLGDPEGDVRRALAAFPGRALVDRILDEYFIEGGKAPSARYKEVPPFSLRTDPELHGLNVVANFVEVYLAKEGGGASAGPVGINYMAKIPFPNPSGIYGAMLAGVDTVFVGAGIPLEVPAMIDALRRHADVEVRIRPEGSARTDEPKILRFSPAELDLDLDRSQPLARPRFVPIVSSHVLASTLLKRAEGAIDGFVIEGPSAGGHNAPPRGALTLNERGEPNYGPRDEVDFDALRATGLPFWLAGSFHDASRYREALALGASGIQVGTPFAFCRESGVTTEIKRRVHDALANDDLEVLKDPRVSPTGFPFNVVRGIGLNEDEDLEADRKCDLGFLRHAYQTESGGINYRCPAAPKAFVQSGGDLDETRGKRCLCNALLATVGLGQVRDGVSEEPLVTAGNDVELLRRLFARSTEYSASDVIDALTVPAETAGSPA
ncbi:MAG: nitronate monooxygenase [Planctomycetes bacterium]|nr:nitronate monooxygenase [Planctomycetota bacterium]